MTPLLLAALAAAAPVPAPVRKAVEAYAPIVRFHPQEQYFPISAERYLAITQPVGNGLRLKPGAPRGGDLATAKVYANVKVSDRTSDIQYWFLYAYNGPGIAYLKYLGKNLRFQPLPDAVMAPCGRHEGDWEHVTATVDNRTGALLSLYLAQHGHGQNIKPYKLQNGRVVIYASKNGHASFPVEGRHYYEEKKFGPIEFRLVNLVAKGRAFDSRGRVQIIGAHRLGGGAQAASLEIPAAPWMKYTGRWGYEEKHPREALKAQMKQSLGSSGAKAMERFGGLKLLDTILDKAGIRGECFAEAGPTPPWSKGNWKGAE